MDVTDFLTEAFGRIPDHVGEAVDGLDRQALVTVPEPASNTIAWLVWHLTRVADSYVAEYAGRPQVWTDSRLAGRFGLEPDPRNSGYGHDAEQVLAVQPESADVLIEYHSAVHDRLIDYLGTLTPAALDEVIDRNWDPPVTLGARLVSILDDQVQHAGQAKYVRGILDRR